MMINDRFYRRQVVTSAIAAALSALGADGMAGQGGAILAGADLNPGWGYQLGGTSWLLPDATLTGKALHALVGYSDRPMGVQIAAYVATLVILVVASRLVHQAPSRRAAAQH